MTLKHNRYRLHLNRRRLFNIGAFYVISDSYRQIEIGKLNERIDLSLLAAPRVDAVETAYFAYLREPIFLLQAICASDLRTVCS